MAWKSGRLGTYLPAMRLSNWSRCLAFGAYTYLLPPSAVVAADSEISIQDLAAFIKANRVNIFEFQKAMRNLYYLWDPDRSPLTPNQDTPSILDPFLDSLKERLDKLTDSYDANPDAARAEFQTYGFAGTRKNSNLNSDGNTNSMNSMNFMPASPTNRVFGVLTRVLSTATDARTAFSNFLAWAERVVGLRHWYSLPSQQDVEWVAPRLFGGTLNQNPGVFVFNSNARAVNRKRMEDTVATLRGALQVLQGLRNSVFKTGIQAEGVGADMKGVIDEIIDVIRFWGDGVQAVRDAYVDIPPLPDQQVFKFGPGDADVGVDEDDELSVSNVPETQLGAFVSELGGGEPRGLMAESVMPVLTDEVMGGNLESCSIGWGLDSQAGNSEAGKRVAVDRDPVTIPFKELAHWAERDARQPLRQFAFAVAYTERLWYRSLPYSRPKYTSPETIVGGKRYGDITLEYLLEGLRDRIDIARAHLEDLEVESMLFADQGSHKIHTSIISSPADPTLSSAEMKLRTQSLKGEDDTAELVSKLESLYGDLSDQSYRVRGLHRWLQDDIMQKRDINLWSKDPLLIAMSVASTRLNPKTPNLAEFEGLRHLLDFFFKIYLRHPLPPSLSGADTNAPDDFHTELRAHLKKIGDWFFGWENAVAALSETYDDIPPLPGAGERDGQASMEDSDKSSIWGLRQWTAGTLPVSRTLEGDVNAPAPQEGSMVQGEYDIDSEDFGISNLPGTNVHDLPSSDDFNGYESEVSSSLNISYGIYRRFVQGVTGNTPVPKLQQKTPRTWF
ncbi:hypothetical protein Dda_1699 [Drechslerella dactyloides]|uniref:Uncharacterized protein n=1 Tax=Drechslerella dactyloides TaxID=74499 RepID=A0AAD6NLN4_DREDA|nr:hypothetical protein Dda_1699 [Drechslerella dactyloides]